ncbi:hypothetical protein [Chitinimonas sp. BJB300]|uniref:hypothetical protein n=1 Tax=Chitinimonas sp. BJB300 TaxID=1559339 RepID=UPI000C0D4CC9|nr:hypothetical protein [Chitinimonas sp. BJB300]PHV09928.1 hypothetical protein CSQ89_18985 [Chitinimonas sp. BJB300]TSJ89670.1 hypothetical protein FG002_005455 [Chitinimonas sp. BJB300]
MNAPTAARPKSRPDQQFELFNESADLASRNVERLVTAQFDGYRDWVAALHGPRAPTERLQEHLDQSLNLGCALFVAQVSAITDAMQLVEKTLAEQQRSLLSNLSAQPNVVGEPLIKAVCVSSCAFDSLSKATRQVANFASTRFSAAAKNAVQQAREKISGLD